MKVFVAGGTGAIGRQLLPQLLAAGHDVVATTRRLGAQPAIADGLNERALIEAVRQAEPDAVIHEMTALAGNADLRHFDRMFATTNQLRIRGTDYLIRAAREVGARRLIVQSYAGWPNIRLGGPVKTEEDPLDPDPPKWQRQSLAAFRHLESAVPAAEGLEGLVLRYGSLYGPGTGMMSSEVAELLRKRRFPIIGDGAGVWSFLHVTDAASATVAALHHGAPGLYNIVDDDPAPAAEWIPHLAKVIGAPPPRRMPVWLARVLAGDVPVSMMTCIRGSSNTKAKRELGWDPWYPSWREGFAAEAAGATVDVREGRLSPAEPVRRVRSALEMPRRES
jgi:nucleoside-diphosphate-sugar epimerase